MRAYGTCQPTKPQAISSSRSTLPVPPPAVCLDPFNAKAHYRRTQALRAAGMLKVGALPAALLPLAGGGARTRAIPLPAVCLPCSACPDMCMPAPPCAPPAQSPLLRPCCCSRPPPQHACSNSSFQIMQQMWRAWRSRCAGAAGAATAAAAAAAAAFGHVASVHILSLIHISQGIVR